MLDNQQVFKQIPKHISEWTEEDVAKWFKINDIQLESNIRISGQQFLNLTPNKLINQLKLSSFLTRKIADWIEFDTSDFDSYVDEATSTGNHNDIYHCKSDFRESSERVSSEKESDEKRQTQQIDEFQQVQLAQCISNKELKMSNDSYQNKVQKLERCRSNDDNPSSQKYQPLKYKPHKHSEGKKNTSQKDDKHLESIKPKPFFSAKLDFKNKLIIKDLVQNNSESREDAQTCNHIPEPSQYFQQKRRPLKKISSQNFLNESDSSKMQEKSYYSNHVKFVSSQLMMGECSVLTAYLENSFIQVVKNTKIGRSTANDLILKTDGVSRNHAEVIVEQEADSEGKMRKRYFLRDVGSKFGTFVQVDPQKPKKVAENDHYSIGQTTIRIDKLKLSKSKEKFDITLTILLTEQEHHSYTSRSIVTIGNRRRQSQSRQPKNSQITKRCVPTKQRRDLQLQDFNVKNYHCRFNIVNGEVYLEQVEGNFLQKIQKNVKFEMVRSKYDVKFGDGDVVFKLEQVYKPLCFSSQ